MNIIKNLNYMTPSELFFLGTVIGMFINVIIAFSILTF